MKIISFEVYRYTLPLVRPLILNGQEQHTREGLLLFIKGDNHVTGLGEIAPLPGFSAERLQEVEKQVFYLRDKVMGNTVPDDLETLTFRFETWVRTWKLFPSVRCGFEVAVLDLLARSRKTALCSLVDPEAPDRVPGTILVGEALRKALQREIVASAFLGVRSFKLKVGAADINTDLERVGAILEVLPSDARFHLDANRQWQYAQALNFIKLLGPAPVEYIEEPVAEAAMLDELGQATSFPLAVDETTREWTPDQAGNITSLQVLVLKPMLLGGWEKTMAWVRFARERGLRPVISSSYESAVGLKALAHLACAAAPEEAAGLDTSKWFGDDLLPEPFEWQNASIIPGTYALEKGDLNFKCARSLKNE